LGAASHHRLSAFFRVAAYTGARHGEVSNLRWADVDWAGPALRIKGSVGISAGQRVEGTTKGGRERIVGLDAGTIDARARPPPQAGWESDGSGRGLVRDRSCVHLWRRGADQPRQHEGAHGEDHPGTRCQYLAEGARFPWHNSTICGIVHATHLLLAGVPVHVVAERLGHADPAITLRVYAHVRRQHADGVADVLRRRSSPVTTAPQMVSMRRS
jgi:integrase